MDLVRRPALRLEPRRLSRVFLLRSEDSRAGVRGDVIAIRAEQPMNGQPRDLAGDVPQRDVHGADGSIGGRPVAMHQRLIETLAIERVLSHHQRLELLDERFTVEMRAAHRGAEKSVAVHALGRLDRDEAELALAGEAAGMPAVRGRRNVAPGEERECHVADLHVRVSRTRWNRAAGPPRAYTREITAKRLLH